MAIVIYGAGRSGAPLDVETVTLRGNSSMAKKKHRSAIRVSKLKPVDFGRFDFAQFPETKPFHLDLGDFRGDTIHDDNIHSDSHQDGHSDADPNVHHDGHQDGHTDTGDGSVRHGDAEFTNIDLGEIFEQIQSAINQIVRQQQKIIAITQKQLNTLAAKVSVELERTSKRVTVLEARTSAPRAKAKVGRKRSSKR